MMNAAAVTPARMVRIGNSLREKRCEKPFAYTILPAPYAQTVSRLFCRRRKRRPPRTNATNGISEDCAERRSDFVADARGLAGDFTRRPPRAVHRPPNQLGRQRVRNGNLAGRHARRDDAAAHQREELESAAG